MNSQSSSRWQRTLAAPLLALLLTVTAGCGGGGGGGNTAAPTLTDTSGDSSGDTTGSEGSLQDVTETEKDGSTVVNLTRLEEALAGISLGVLTDDEADGLLWMREEEKLAGDVYRALYAVHGLRVFSNIASSEDTHTEAVKALLDRYALADPSEGLDEGIFSNGDLQVLYDTLVARGTPTLLDALYVGVAIEELDIWDIENWEISIDDNDDIELVYENLKKGSRNHLRSFYRLVLDNGGSYTPEYLSQEEFDAIVNSDYERGA